MRTTLRLSSQFRQPLIRFIGRRQIPSEPDVPHPHPQAPPEFQRVFGTQSSSSKATAKTSEVSEEPTARTYSQFWEAPSRYWNYRAHVLEEAEMDAIMSGGATAS